MEQLTKDERIAKIKELAGDDIAVVLNCRIEGGMTVYADGKQLLIEKNIVTSSQTSYSFGL